MVQHTRERLVRWLALGTVGVTVAALAGTVAVLASPSAREWLGFGLPELKPAYSVRQTIDVPSGIFDRAPVTMVVFANYTCGACQGSAPVMAALIGDLASRSIPSVLVTGETVSDASATFAREAGFATPDVWHLDLRKFKVKRVPLVVLVDRAGTVLFAKEGLLQAADRPEILAAALAARKTSS